MRGRKSSASHVHINCSPLEEFNPCPQINIVYVLRVDNIATSTLCVVKRYMSITPEEFEIFSPLVHVGELVSVTAAAFVCKVVGVAPANLQMVFVQDIANAAEVTLPIGAALVAVTVLVHPCEVQPAWQ